jgi:hypothetical protein
VEALFLLKVQYILVDHIAETLAVSGTDEGAACKDRNHYCTAWAKTGQCRANPDYMLSYCRKACNQC